MKNRLRMVVDAAMTAALLFLMPYEMIGTLAHEVIGTLMFTLAVVHHILNRRWTAQLLRGRYTAMRAVQTAVVLLLFLCLIGSALSGVIVSRHLYVALRIRPLISLARRVHILCAYWGFVLMSLHLGLHWRAMLSAAERWFPRKTAAGTILLRAAAVVIVLYGYYAFVKRDVGDYLFLRSAFVFFDPSEPAARLILDYMAVMGVFVFLGDCLARVLLRWGKHADDGRR